MVIQKKELLESKIILKEKVMNDYGDFYDDDTSYDEFKTVNDMEVEMLSVLPKNAFLPIDQLIVR